MKLIEIAQPVDVDKIKRTLDYYHITGYTINPDGTVDVDGDVEFIRQMTSIPVQFRNVTGFFNCGNTKITSLAGAPLKVGGSFMCNDTELKSLSGVHRIIKEINGAFVAPENATHLLGLLLIKGVTEIIVWGNDVSNILNKHLKDKDIILAQDELLDAGFVEQAKL